MGQGIVVSMSLRVSAIWIQVAAGLVLAQAPPIHFRYQAIPFTLENSETERRYAPETMVGGVGAFDFDNDGDIDIFFANGADIRSLKKSDPKYSNRLFANDGKGGFTDVTKKAGLEGTGFDTGVAVADYDNDGDADLFVGGLHRNTLYRNNGDATFTDVTEKAGLATVDKQFGPLWSVGGVWADVNSDGRLDLFVANYLGWSLEKEPTCTYEGRNEYCHPRFYKETPNQLFLNKGDGTFEDVSAAWGLRSNPGKGMGAALADYDNDGKPDIFIANDKLYNFLFRNTGTKFEELGFEAGVALAEHGNMISGMGVDFRDLDNDGHPDIVLLALDNETFPIYRNTGKGTFREVTSSTKMTVLSRPMSGYSPNIADFDNDGWKDIFASRGHVQSTNMQPRTIVEQHNTVFRNHNGTGWAALTAEAGLAGSGPKRHRGAAVADFNGDGMLDVVVSALAAPAEIWMNDSTSSGHWLALRLEGKTSNRDGIGAKVKVVTKAGTQHNHRTSAAGYASASAAPVHFGLGAAETAESIEIRWPSGKVQTLQNVRADQVLLIKESE
jgi:hypothetical protein